MNEQLTPPEQSPEDEAILEAIRPEIRQEVGPVDPGCGWDYLEALNSQEPTS